jgi:type IV pilus assembly protein PilW
MQVQFISGMVGRRQRGLSVVELLISLVIGMAVIAGSIQVVVSSKRSFMDQDEVTFIQTNARFSVDLLGKDIRMAGYLGCATQKSVQLANSINNDAGGYISLHGLVGYEGEVNTNSFPADFRAKVKAGSDGVLIRRAADSGEMDVSKHVAASATVHLWDEHSYKKGSTLMIADASCRNVGIFQVSGPNGLPANHITHNTGSGTNNCTKIIKGNFSCDPSCKAVSCGGYGTASGAYGPGSKIMEFVAHAYYIGESDVMPGMPALRRQVFNANGPAGTSSEEIALGVEDMEILYAVDSNSDGDVDQMRKASEMDLNGNGTISNEEWDQVISVKINLVFRSQLPALPVAEKKTLAGTEYNDRFMRQVVNSTFRIRNRG